MCFGGGGGNSQPPAPTPPPSPAAPAAAGSDTTQRFQSMRAGMYDSSGTLLTPLSPDTTYRQASKGATVLGSTA